MKKHCCLFILLLCCRFCIAQPYHAFPDSNAMWSLEQTVSYTAPFTNDLVRDYNGLTYALGHDTIINSENYVLVGTSISWHYQTYINDLVFSYNYSVNLPGQIFGGIREDSNKKIWFINFSEEVNMCATFPNSFWPLPIDSEVLLYDFNLQVGQTLTYPFQRTVSTIDSIQLEDGQFRRRFIFSNPSDYWIEGVGSSFGLFGAYKLPDNSDYDHCNIWLNCYWENGQYIFHKNPFPEGVTCDSTYVGINDPTSNTAINFFPNPFTTQLNIAAQSNEALQVCLYDIVGRQVCSQSFTGSVILNTQPLAAGMYIYVVRSKNGVVAKGKVVRE